MGEPVVFLFSGQGSQYYRMAHVLYNQSPVFKQILLRLDRVAQDLIGTSIVETIYAKKQPSEKFDRTLFTHPAIFMVEVAVAEMLCASGIQPDYVCGTSLGEYAAAAVAGVLGTEQLLECIVKQAQWLEERCPNGRMMAVLHDPALYHKLPELREHTELAAVNYSNHFVISGPGESIDRGESLLRQRNITSQVLPVSHPFHSAWIDPAAPPFLELLKEKQFRKPLVPLISSLTGHRLEQVTPSYFWDVVRQPIQFPTAVQTLEQAGNGCVYIDLGPGGTLLHFLKSNLAPSSRSSGFALITPFHQELKNLETITSLFPPDKRHSPEREVHNMLAYVFPGQGAQEKGMGADLFDHFPELTAKADEILGYSIKQLCLDDPQEQLGQTQFTQPALFVVNALSYLKKVQETGRKPQYVAGHSLGEYDALFAAGAVDFETGLKLVKKRGELMSQAKGGGMAAVVGLKAERVEQILQENNLDNVQVANYNSPSQVVIAGPKDEILRVAPIFQHEEGLRMYIPLKVSGAFHSRYMSESKAQFEAFLDTCQFGELNLTILSNVHARPYKQADIKKNLVDQITHSVKWTEIIRYLMGLGDIEIEEVGPGNVLKGLVRAIKREAEPLDIAAIEREEKALAAQAKAKANAEAQARAKALAKAEAEANKQAEISQKEVAVARESTPAKKGHRQVATPVVLVPPEHSPQPAGAARRLTADALGDSGFRHDYKLKYAYVTGSMNRGISSKELVVKVARAGCLGFLGTAGLSTQRLESDLAYIRHELKNGETFGVNVSYNINQPDLEEELVDICLRHGVTLIEASGYLSISRALVRYRLHGLTEGPDGSVAIAQRVLAKVTRPEVAEMFLSPAPERIVKQLLAEHAITKAQADLLSRVPMADDICAEADGAGPTEQAASYSLFPTIARLRDNLMATYGYARRVRVGAAGGLGTPEAVAAAFVMGADFVLTGSINQCTVEAGTSDGVKDLLNAMNVQDTAYAPDEHLFEVGAKVQVLKKGFFFPTRANKLYDLYRQHNAWQEIDEKTKTQLQTKYFKRTFDQVYEEVKTTFPAHEIEKAENSPKHKMALVFRWYSHYASQLALNGNQEHKTDYQVYCGPAMGAFNQWVKGSPLEHWRNRHVDEIAERIMSETAELLNVRFLAYLEA